MNNKNIICAANAVMVQFLAHFYLVGSLIDPVMTLEGACVTTRRTSNRTSVPDDAATLSHYVEHPELGFSFRLRTVWREGRLFKPTATHVVIEQEWDDAGLGSPAAVSAAINSWLQAVTS